MYQANYGPHANISLQQLDLKSFELGTAEGKVPALKLVWNESASEDKKTSIEQVI